MNEKLQTYDRNSKHYKSFMCVWIKRCYQYSIKRIYHSFFCHKKNVAKDAVCVVSARKFSCEIFTSYDILILVGFFML